jgi:hypothetical protein
MLVSKASKNRYIHSIEGFCDKTYRNQGSNEYAQYQRMTSSGSAYLSPSFAKPEAGMNPPTSAPTTSLPDIPKDKTYKSLMSLKHT